MALNGKRLNLSVQNQTIAELINYRFTMITRGLIPKYLLILTALLIVAVSHGLHAQTIRIAEGDNHTQILENEYTILTLQNSLATLNAQKVKAGEQHFTRLHIPGYGYSNQIGYPQLPVYKRLIELPLDAEVEILITYKSFHDLPLSDFQFDDPVIPVQPSLSKSADPDEFTFRIKEDAYQFNGFIGDDLVSIHPAGIMRGLKIARIEIAPVQYNPVANVLRVFDEIIVEFRFTGGNIAQTIAMKTQGINPFFAGISQMLINYKSPDKRENFFGNQPVTYIIVSDPQFEDALQPFISWKTKKGFRVVEAYTSDPDVGNTTTSIKSFLTNFYNDPPVGYEPQTFILIVGDVAQVPSFSGSFGNHPSDLYYAEYTGDMLPEAFIGRFSANNLVQLQPQIDKTLEYEQYLFPDPSFLDEVVMVAGHDTQHQMQWGNGQINYGTNYYFNETNGLYSHTYLQPEPPGGNYAMQIRQNISDGVGFANYTAHCSASGWANPNFTVNHIDALQNQSKYPLMIGNCCASVAFHNNSFGEDIMRAEGKGAIGYIGGSNNTFWDEDFWWAVGFKAISANPTYDSNSLGAYDRLFHTQDGITVDDWHVTQGQISMGGNLAVLQSGSPLTNYYWEIYHLMGDPSLMVYFSQPPDVTASYPLLIPLGAESFTVNTHPFAYVAVSLNGELYGAAFAGEDGVANVDFFQPFNMPGDAEIVITGENLKPYFSSVLVASPDGPFVLLQQATVNDAQHGNSNGLMDYAETISLDLVVQNFGLQAGEDVTLQLISTSDFIEIETEVATLGNIESNQVINLTNVFKFHVSEEIPDGHAVNFTLNATDGVDSWSSNFNLTAHAPALSFAGFMIHDPNGNQNGKLDPGETVEVTIYAVNKGSAAAFNLNGELFSNDPYIAVLTTGMQHFGDIASPDEIISAVFEVTAGDDTPAGFVANFNLALHANHSINAESQFEVVVGPIPLLVIDLDGNQNSADSIYKSVTHLGIYAEMAEVIPEDLSLYSSLFICLGVYSQNYALSLAEGARLAGYLNAGGRIYMEGGDTWYYDPKTDVHPMFGINGLEDGSGDLGTVTGAEGSIAQGITFNYIGDNNWIDRLEPVNGAQVIFSNQTPAYHCAISRIGNGYKTIGSSFEFGGIESDSIRNEVMMRYLEFFNITLPGTMAINLWADPDDICQGDITQLMLEISGGSGTFSYQWYPETGLNDPTLRNPEASPEATTDYTVIITDQLTGNTMQEEITIYVREKPETPEITQVGLSLVSDQAFGNQWYNDDGLIEGATSNIFFPQSTSNYYVITTNTLGCASDTSNVIYFQSTFIDELIAQGAFRIYPNPTSGIVNLDFITEDAQAPVVYVFNAFGQMMINLTTENIKRTGSQTITYDLSGLPGGVYYFKFTDMNRVINKKVILSK